VQLSHSELKTYAVCRRKWYISHYLKYGLAPDKGSPVGKAPMGTRVHLCMEAYYGYGLDPMAVLDWQYAQELAAHPEFEEELIKEKRLASAVVEGYFQWAAEEGFDVGVEVVATERQVSYHMPASTGTRGFDLIAKLDMVVQRELDGATLFRDWKTVDTLTKADAVGRDTQMRTYAMLRMLTASAGERVDGGQYVMLKRSARTARARPPFYGVAEVRYNRHDLNSTFQRVQSIGTEILDTTAALDAGASHQSVCYTSPGDHCSWMCSFRDVCTMFDDGSRAEDALRGEFVQIDPYARYTDDAIDRVRLALKGDASVL
jgi:PD-(D/E)XK nuclease superfamily